MVYSLGICARVNLKTASCGKTAFTPPNLFVAKRLITFQLIGRYGSAYNSKTYVSASHSLSLEFSVCKVLTRETSRRFTCGPVTPFAPQYAVFSVRAGHGREHTFMVAVRQWALVSRGQRRASPNVLTCSPFLLHS